MKAFYITVQPDDALGEALRRALPNFETTVISQFDYRNRDRAAVLREVDKDSFLIRYGGLPSNGAVGCAMAHRFAWKSLLESDAAWALVLEDDVELSSIDPDFVLEACSKTPDFDVLSLGSLSAAVQSTPSSRIGRFNVHRSVYYCRGGFAYVVSRSGATRLLQPQSPAISRYADWPLQAWQMKMYLTRPNAVRLTDRPSGVQTPVTDTVSTLRHKVIHRTRHHLWKAIGAVRVSVLGDVVVDGADDVSSGRSAA